MPRSDRPVAVVTGGAKRLGRAIVEMLAAAGHDIVIVTRASTDEARAVCETIAQRGGHARFAQLDIGDKAAVASLFASIQQTEGRVDVLVNNVGNYNPQHVAALDPDQWDTCIRSNLSGAYYCTHHAIALMKESKEGNRGLVVSIGMSGLETSAAVHGVDFFVSKAGLLTLTRSLAKAYAKSHIRVNMISPGMLDNSIDLPTDIEKWVPLGRAGKLEDIVGAVRFLLDAEYVTGVNLDVAGGYRL